MKSVVNYASFRRFATCAFSVVAIHAEILSPSRMKICVAKIMNLIR